MTPEQTVLKNNDIIKDVCAFMIRKHGDQTDKVGKPYWMHPYRVMGYATKIIIDFELHGYVDYLDIAVAADCHDLLEDTDTTIEELKELGVSDRAVEIIQTCTRKEDESYDEFIRRIGEDVGATIVKLADLEDNLDVKRFAGIRALDNQDRKRINKYLAAYDYLYNILDNI